jgi:L-2,4-diaminobutyric acid acetyltransferase
MEATDPTRSTRVRCAEADLLVRSPRVADGTAIWRLASATPVLDANSAYAYVLWCRDFAATSIVAVSTDGSSEGADTDVAGFVVGYRRPAAPDVLFVWQVAIDERLRRRGIAARLVVELVDRLRLAGVRRLEATVAPSNAPSIALFRAVADRLGAACTYPAPGGFDARDLPGHDAEPLLAIGPF